jgi:hypothetical protein
MDAPLFLFRFSPLGGEGAGRKSNIDAPSARAGILASGATVASSAPAACVLSHQAPDFVVR